ncbi:hypothetical protein LWI28_001316 [Acer negundo]|uniref:Uncharacterized protein n=1 Tax=Acer negundo TaxID=4023 RepID=A0AAD5JGL3_ACENE|nr:hypothetical protein LWI28_001316 [Acer negundo]KAK4837183.1 hypothetical protein QYF36_003465 [Acer negundo]
MSRIIVDPNKQLLQFQSPPPSHTHLSLNSRGSPVSPGHRFLVLRQPLVKEELLRFFSRPSDILRHGFEHNESLTFGFEKDQASGAAKASGFDAKMFFLVMKKLESVMGSSKWCSKSN